ncbi:MAG: hypothetical protein IIA17_08590 [candidate division Zixibacteria bacterium]|nr:hypothetical protein [candidate division Zixibacteria bacterium]
MRKTLEDILKIEKNNWSKKTYNEILTMETPFSYESNAGNISYEVKVLKLEQEEKYIRLAIEINDDGISSLFPVSGTMFFYADGRVDY